MSNTTQHKGKRKMTKQEAEEAQREFAALSNLLQIEAKKEDTHDIFDKGLDSYYATEPLNSPDVVRFATHQWEIRRAGKQVGDPKFTFAAYCKKMNACWGSCGNWPCVFCGRLLKLEFRKPEEREWGQGWYVGRFRCTEPSCKDLPGQVSKYRRKGE